MLYVCTVPSQVVAPCSAGASQVICRNLRIPCASEFWGLSRSMAFMHKTLLAIATISCLSTGAQASPINGEIMEFLVRNGVSDSVESIAHIKRINLLDLPKCRISVADEIYGMSTDVGGLASSFMTDPAGTVSTMASSGSEVFSTAFDVLNHFENNLGPDILRCAEASAKAQNFAGCQPYVDQLRRGVMTAFLKMGSVSRAIYSSIMRRCAIKEPEKEKDGRR